MTNKSNNIIKVHKKNLCTFLVVIVVHIVRGLGWNEEDALEFDFTLGLEVDPGGGVRVILADALVKGLVRFIIDFFRIFGPDCRLSVDPAE